MRMEAKADFRVTPKAIEKSGSRSFFLYGTILNSENSSGLGDTVIAFDDIAQKIVDQANRIPGQIMAMVELEPSAGDLPSARWEVISLISFTIDSHRLSTYQQLTALHNENVQLHDEEMGTIEQEVSRGGYSFSRRPTEANAEVGKRSHAAVKQKEEEFNRFLEAVGITQDKIREVERMISESPVFQSRTPQHRLRGVTDVPRFQ